jgi:hypothetical protein
MMNGGMERRGDGMVTVTATVLKTKRGTTIAATVTTLRTPFLQTQQLNFLYVLMSLGAEGTMIRLLISWRAFYRACFGSFFSFFSFSCNIFPFPA